MFGFITQEVDSLTPKPVIYLNRQHLWCNGELVGFVGHGALLAVPAAVGVLSLQHIHTIWTYKRPSYRGRNW